MGELEQRLDRDGPECGKEAVGRVGIRSIDDDLAMAGLAKSLVARLVAGDEPVGVDHCGKAIGCLWGGVAAPGQSVDCTSPFLGLFGPVIGMQECEVKIVKILSIGKRVADEHAVGVRTAKGRAAKRTR